MIRALTHKWIQVRRSSDVDAVVRRYRLDIYRLSLSMTASAEAAEDVTQEVIIRIAKSAESLADVDAVWPWIRTITVRCAINSLRKPSHVELPSDLLNAAPDPNEMIAVSATLDRLRPDHRVILALAAGQGLSYDEISETLGIPVGSVASRLHSAREEFKRLWEDPS